MDNYNENSTNTDKILERIVNDFNLLMGEQLSEYEVSIIKKVLLVLREPSPTMLGAIFNKLDEIELLREEYNFILYKVRFRYQFVSQSYNSLYYKHYARISKQGRPNSASVEAEVYNDDTIKANKNASEQLYNLLKFLEDENMLLRSKERILDAKRQTVV